MAVNWTEIPGMDTTQRERVIAFVHLISEGITEELLKRIPGLAERTQANNPGRPIHPTDPAFPRGRPAAPQLYEVVREDEYGENRVESTTVPQLLAEMNDNILTLMEVMETVAKNGSKPRRKRK